MKTLEYQLSSQAVTPDTNCRIRIVSSIKKRNKVKRGVLMSLPGFRGSNLESNSIKVLLIAIAQMEPFMVM